MRFGVLMCAFREESKIRSSINQFKNTPVEEIVIACSKKPWKGRLERDKTAELALESHATVRLHDWEKEEDQKNWGMERLTNMDWVFITAPDMYMTKESIFSMIDFLENEENPNNAYGCACKTYWKDLDTIVKPDWPFIIAAIRPTVRFNYSSQIVGQTDHKMIPGVLIHHLSWVKTDEEMRTKIQSYTHADEIDPSWYQNVWLDWHKDLTNIHPTSPSDYQYTVNYSLPPELRALLDEKWVKKL